MLTGQGHAAFICRIRFIRAHHPPSDKLPPSGASFSHKSTGDSLHGTPPSDKLPPSGTSFTLPLTQPNGSLGVDDVAIPRQCFPRYRLACSIRMIGG